MAWGLTTYNETTIREDLLDVLTDVSPDETPLLTLFGTSTAKGTLHEWLVRNIERPTTVTTAVEGADADYGDLITNTRVSNTTQILTFPIRVSRTERRSNVAAVGDPFAFQKADGLRQLKLRMEHSIINSVYATGNASGARSMTGLDRFITSLVTMTGTGASFNETVLNEMVADAYTYVSADKIFDMVLCSIKIKQAIAGFSANSTRYIDASDRRLVKDVLVYDSAAGSHRIMHHRDVPSNAVSTTVYGLREEMHKVAYFDKPLFEELAKTGDADKGQWVTEFTLEVLNEKADIKRYGFAQNG